jgi:hypothetical protein
MQHFPWLRHRKNRRPPPDTKVAHPTPADHTRGSFSSRPHPYLFGFSDISESEMKEEKGLHKQGLSKNLPYVPITPFHTLTERHI